MNCTGSEHTNHTLLSLNLPPQHRVLVQFSRDTSKKRCTRQEVADHQVTVRMTEAISRTSKHVRCKAYHLLHELLCQHVIMTTPSAVVNGSQHGPSLHDSSQHKEVREVHVLYALLDSCVPQPGNELRQILSPYLLLLIYQVLISYVRTHRCMHACSAHVAPQRSAEIHGRRQCKQPLHEMIHFVHKSVALDLDRPPLHAGLKLSILKDDRPACEALEHCKHKGSPEMRR